MRQILFALLIGLFTTFVPAQSVQLEWDPNPEPDIAGYNVYRSATSEGDPSRVNIDLIEGTTYTDSSVSYGDTYFYAVTAVNTSEMESDFSNQVEASVLNPNPPSAPGNLRIVGTGQTAILLWKIVPEADSYLIRRGLRPNRLKTIGSSQLGLYVDRNVPLLRRSIFYRVIALNDFGFNVSNLAIHQPRWLK